MSNIAIIPARGGSKRIPRKNIKDFLGKPIIAYSIQAAIDSQLFDEVMVSTDDKEIAEVALKYGAKVPFMRSADTANDYATIADVINEVMIEYKKYDRFFKNICCILPTAPLILSEDIIYAYKKIKESDYTSAYPIVQYSYPIMRSLSMDDNNNLKMIWPDFLNVRSQDIPAAYHDSGTFYWVERLSFEKYKTFLTPKSAGIIINEMNAQDIDTESDWAIAELKYRLLHKNK